MPIFRGALAFSAPLWYTFCWVFVFTKTIPMSIESNQSSECLHNEPLLPETETEKLPHKSRKAYGITSLICGLYCSLLPLSFMLDAYQITDGFVIVLGYLPEVILAFLYWSAFPSAVVGILFGAVGICRERFFTLGWFFAITGLILSSWSLRYMVFWWSFNYFKGVLGVVCC